MKYMNIAVTLLVIVLSLGLLTFSNEVILTNDTFAQIQAHKVGKAIIAVILFTAVGHLLAVLSFPLKKLQKN